MLLDFLQQKPLFLLISFGIGFLAGLVKGTVGFAMPMILLSGLSILMPAKQALAALILPTLFTNIIQSSTRGTTRLILILKRHNFFPFVTGCLILYLEMESHS